MDCSLPGSSVSGILQARILDGLPFPSPEDLPDPGMEPRSPALQADSLPTELRGKPKNTGVGSLSLLQRIFLTQESNRDLLHCRQILYRSTRYRYEENFTLVPNTLDDLNLPLISETHLK